MKLKIALLVTPLLTLSISVFATSVSRDSIGVENQGGKKVILHKLDPKDNYYSIGRRYKVSPKDIIAFNNNAALKIGGIIKVPTQLSFDGQATQTTIPVTQTKPQVQPPVTQPVTKAPVQAPPVQAPVTQPKPQVTTPAVQTPPVQQQPATTTPATPDNTTNVQQYKVSAGETLFSIAKRFNTSVDDIIKLNGLTTNDLKPDQIIKVRTGMPPEDRPVAKQDVLIVMTKNTADALGALDKRIHVIISYGSPNE